MNIKYFLLVTIATFGLAATASAAPRWEVDAAQLPPGMTKEKAVKLLDDIDKASAKEREQEEAAEKRKAERVQKAARKYEDQLAKAVEKDPELLALQAKLNAGIEALNNPDLSDDERAARIERMQPDLINFRNKGLAKAGINVPAMNAEIGNALNEGVVTRGVEGESGSEQLQEHDGAFYYISPDDAILPTDSDVESRSLKSSMLATSTTTVKYLGDPWPTIESERKVGSSNGTANPEEGSYKVVALLAFLGSGTNRMGLAHFYTVPGGVSRIRVSAQLPSTIYRSYAAGAIGGAQSKTSSTIEVWDGSSRRLCRTYKLHADVWFVIVGGKGEDGSHNIVLDCEFTAPAAGRDIVFKFVSDSFLQAWGLYNANGSVSGTPTSIKLTLYK